MQFQTLRDITSNFARKAGPYARKGEIVTLISQSGDVVIAATKDGNRFPVRREDLRPLKEKEPIT